MSVLKDAGDAGKGDQKGPKGGFKSKSQQAFRFMVGSSHCPMISKYGPSLSKAVGPVDPSLLVMKKSHFNKKIFILQRFYEFHNTGKYMQVVNTIKPVLSSH